MPFYMKSLLKQAQMFPQRDKASAATDEVSMYYKLSLSIKALIVGAEALMKPLTTQHRLLEGVTSLSGYKKDNEESVINARLVTKCSLIGSSLVGAKFDWHHFSNDMMRFMYIFQGLNCYFDTGDGVWLMEVTTSYFLQVKLKISNIILFYYATEKFASHSIMELQPR